MPVSRAQSSAYSVERPHATLSRYLDALCAEFGWDRMVFSDKGKPTGWGLDDLPATDDPRDFFVEYLRRQLMSKYDDGKTSKEKKAAALQKFHEAEDICRATEERLHSDRDANIIPFVSGHAMIHGVASKIDRLLGDFCWSEAEEGFSFGPGRTTSLPWLDATPLAKYTGLPDATVDMLPLVNAIKHQYPGWISLFGQGSPRLVVGNSITTVPKNYKTDRTIAIEPDLAMFCQKGIGSMIRRRLKKRRIDLDDQSRNRELAQIGSIDGSLSTIDLSMASDTVSWALVDALLPPDWLRAMEMVRSKYGVLPCGTVLRYCKFSSMGNGFTFELESLIFWAICQHVIEVLGLKGSPLGVYGDDLVVPTAAAKHIVAALTWFGFTANPKKTHVNGYFRESCGGHYFKGVDVTPFYIRKPLVNVAELFLLHNSISRWCSRPIPGYRWTGPRGSLRDLTEMIIAESGHRGILIPDGVGDVGFISAFDQATPRTRYHSDTQKLLYHVRFIGRFERVAPRPKWASGRVLVLATAQRTPKDWGEQGFVTPEAAKRWAAKYKPPLPLDTGEFRCRGAALKKVSTFCDRWLDPHPWV